MSSIKKTKRARQEDEAASSVKRPSKLLKCSNDAASRSVRISNSSKRPTGQKETFNSAARKAARTKTKRTKPREVIQNSCEPPTSRTVLAGRNTLHRKQSGDVLTAARTGNVNPQLEPRVVRKKRHRKAQPDFSYLFDHKLNPFDLAKYAEIRRKHVNTGLDSSSSIFPFTRPRTATIRGAIPDSTSTRHTYNAALEDSDAGRLIIISDGKPRQPRSIRYSERHKQRREHEKLSSTESVPIVGRETNSLTNVVERAENPLKLAVSAVSVDESQPPVDCSLEAKSSQKPDLPTPELTNPCLPLGAQLAQEQLGLTQVKGLFHHLGHNLLEKCHDIPLKIKSGLPRITQLARDRHGLVQAKRLSRAVAWTARCSLNRLQEGKVKTSQRSSKAPVEELTSETPRECNVQPRPLTLRHPEHSFLVDTDGNGSLEHYQSLYPHVSIPRDEDILGSAFYDRVTNSRHIVSGLELSGEQQALFDRAMEGRNIFYTGSAGSGKSHVLRATYAQLVHEGKCVVKAGPTGMAAINIGGQTTYRLAGWMPNIKKCTIRKLENDARTGERWVRWNEIDVIILDESSMVDSHHFSRLDRVARAARQPKPPFRDDGSRDYDTVVEWCESDPYGHDTDRSPHDRRLPFGGIQVIVTGDFSQLPPVKPFTTCFPCGSETEAADTANGPWRCPMCRKTFDLDDSWAFQSPAWKACRFLNIQLKEVHRQADPEFVEILETIRSRDLSMSQYRRLLACRREVKDAIALFPTNKEANRMNAAKLRCIEGLKITYGSVEDFTHNELHRKYKKLGVRGSGLKINALYDHRFAAALDVKIGMPVMLLLGGSPETGLVNGSRGTVVRFEYYNRENPSKSRSTVPSRISSDDDEYADYRDALIDEWFDDNKRSLLPLVEFPDGQQQLIYPACEIEEYGDTKPYTLLSRTQLPLCPAWAITIHKSQGLSLDFVVVNVDKAKAPKAREMVYVAISRATSLEGLQIVTEDDLSILKPGGRLGPPDAVVKAFRERVFGKPEMLSS